MRLTRVAIRNHARVANLDVRLGRHLVIVGANDTGKTTVLRALDSLLRAPLSQLHAWFDPTLPRDPAASLEIEATLDGLTEDDQAAFADEIELVATDDGDHLIRVSVRLSVVVDPADPESIGISRRFVKDGQELRGVRHADLERFGWTFLPASRSADRELGASRRGAVRDLLSEVDLGNDAETLRAALDKLREVLRDAESLEAVRYEVARALTELYPAPVSVSDVSIELPRTTDDDLLGDVDFHLQRDDVAQALADQSDGMRALTTVALHRLARTRAQIVAIDEPELHLHPRSQSRLASHLSLSDGQVVLATHAPAVVAAFSPADVVVMTSEGGIRQDSPTPGGRSWKFYEERWLDSALEPLTARGLVLVEGVSDRILVRAVAVALGKDPDRLGWSIVAVHGALNFKPALELFGPEGFDLPVRVLVDEAEAPLVATALGCEADKVTEFGVCVCKGDLEDEVIRGLGVERHAELLTASGSIDHREILAACSAPDLTALESSEYHAWCTRDRNKVRLAFVLGQALTADDALRLGAVTSLVEALPEA